MKLAIVTFHWANNYGALLQAYGLRRTLEKMGHSVQFLDYAPPHNACLGGVRWACAKGGACWPCKE